MHLVFHQAALGDFVLALPTLRRLRGQVTLVVPWSHGRVAARLMPQAGLLDAELFEFTRLWAQGGPSKVSPAVADVFDAATRVVNFVAEAQSVWATNVRRLCGGVPLATVRPRPEGHWTKPLRNWHAQQLGAHDVSLEPESPFTRYGEPPLDAASVRRQSPHWAIHPGSGGVAKCWPLARFIEFAEYLRHRGDAVTFLVGPAELERGIADKLKRDVDPQHLRSIREIDDFCFALHGITHYLGNDAGPTHLAAQLGLPTTALFGPSDPRVWAPLGPAVRLVAPPQPTLITWLSVEALKENLDVH